MSILWVTKSGRYRVTETAEDTGPLLWLEVRDAGEWHSVHLDGASTVEGLRHEVMAVDEVDPLDHITPRELEELHECCNALSAGSLSEGAWTGSDSLAPGPAVHVALPLRGDGNPTR